MHTRTFLIYSHWFITIAECNDHHVEVPLCKVSDRVNGKLRISGYPLLKEGTTPWCFYIAYINSTFLRYLNLRGAFSYKQEWNVLKCCAALYYCRAILHKSLGEEVMMKITFK